LEELELEYELKLYHRDPVNHLAEHSLFEVHPLGKSPILELDYLDGKETKKLTESGHIVNYLIKHFDTENKLRPDNERDEESIDYYIQLSEGSVQPFLTITFLHERMLENTSSHDKPIVGNALELLDGTYTTPQILRVFDMLEKFLLGKCEEQNYTSSSMEIYFVGDKLSAADIMLELNIAFAFEKPDVIKPVHRSKYVYLSKWLSQIKHRRAYLRAVERIEALGKKEYAIHYA